MDTPSTGQNIPGPRAKPVLAYDGDCAFCMHWVGRWRQKTGDAVEYVTSADAATRFPQARAKDFAKAVRLILPDGNVIGGAHAVFRLLEIGTGRSFLLRCYRHVPLFASVAEAVYRLVARHRPLASRMMRLRTGKGGDSVPPTDGRRS